MDVKNAIQSMWRGDLGVWMGVTESERVVANGDYAPLDDVLALSPAPRAVFVKFGGDWGGLWGSESRWFDIAQRYPMVVPYFYCLPQNWQAYPALAGAMHRVGFRMAVADVEYEWDGYETQLSQMLDAWDLDSNLLGLCGLAWFDGYRNWEAFGRAVNGRPLLYMPMAYVGGLTAPGKLAKPPGVPRNWDHTRTNHARAWIDAVVPDVPRSYIIDGPSASADDAIAMMHEGISGSFWYYGDLDASAWSRLDHVEESEEMLSISRMDIDETNTNLGQSLAWIDEIDTNASQALAWITDVHGRLVAQLDRPDKQSITDASDLTAAVDDALETIKNIVDPMRSALHRARQLTKGE